MQRQLPGVLLVCEIGVCEGTADQLSNAFADWKAAMSRPILTLSFEQALDSLRAHSFEVSPAAGVAGGMLVSKFGAAAVLVAAKDKDAPAAFAVAPGALVRGEVARLLDRGFQKFISTSQFEQPATASQLQTIHHFTEELKQLTGAATLYNESLGTTSDLYEYDRLKGREAVQATAARPWETAGSH